LLTEWAAAERKQQAARGRIVRDTRAAFAQVLDLGAERP
jgi:hypothetical protein